jgi:hypothetical protein
MHILWWKLAKVSSCANLSLAIKPKLPGMLEGASSRVAHIAEVARIPDLGKAYNPAVCVGKNSGGTHRWDIDTASAIQLGWRVHRQRTWHSTWLCRESFDWSIFASTVGQGREHTGDRIERGV